MTILLRLILPMLALSSAFLVGMELVATHAIVP